MTPSYTLAYRRKFSPFKRKIRNVIAHSLDKQTDKMFIRTVDSGFEVLKWSQCAVCLGIDWIQYVEEAEKKRIEREAKGQK